MHRFSVSTTEFNSCHSSPIALYTPNCCHTDICNLGLAGIVTQMQIPLKRSVEGILYSLVVLAGQKNTFPDECNFSFIANIFFYFPFLFFFFLLLIQISQR